MMKEIVKMNVKLLEFTPNPEKIVATAARLCYSPATIDETSENLTPEKISAFVNSLFILSNFSIAVSYLWLLT